MPAPLAKGLIIAASVLVAAGIAIYESPQVRQFIEHSRRKIAVALHSLGDEIQPRRSGSFPNDAETAEQARRKRMEEIVRRNQIELIRQAKEEGIAVDLDELARIGREGVEVEMMEYDRRNKNRGRGSSFDDIVGSDGMLRDNHPLIKLEEEENTARTVTATANATSDEGLRRRGQHFPTAPVLTDLHEHTADGTTTAPLASRESTATVQGEPLIDIDAEDPPFSLPDEHTQTASIASLPSSYQAQAQDGSQSFHSFGSTSVMSVSDMEQSNQHIFYNSVGEEPEVMSTGTLTPTEDGFSTAASMVGSQADDVGVLSMTNDEDHDARSEAFSDGGFSELGDRIGAHTPSSWTDVGSDDGSEYAGANNQPPNTHYHL